MDFHMFIHKKDFQIVSSFAIYWELGNSLFLFFSLGDQILVSVLIRYILFGLVAEISWGNKNSWKCKAVYVHIANFVLVSLYESFLML